MHTVQIMLNCKEQDMLTYMYTYLLIIHTITFKLHYFTTVFTIIKLVAY